MLFANFLPLHEFLADRMSMSTDDDDKDKETSFYSILY